MNEPLVDEDKNGTPAIEIVVSICCITYNHEKYVADTIEGFLMQRTNFGIEILIHDDASTDNTANIIKKYEQQYPNLIKPIYQTENQYSKGVTRINSRFNGSRAKGKYIALCEGDDYWIDPYKLQKQIDYLENHPDCTMCIHASKRVDVNKNEILPMLGFAEQTNRIFTFEEIGYRFFATASRVYRKDAMENPPDWYYKTDSGDLVGYLLLMSKGYGFYMSDVMCAYRVGVPGSSNDRFKKMPIQEKERYYRDRIYIFKDFDAYTKQKFACQVQKNILNLEGARISVYPQLGSRIKEWRELETGINFPMVSKTYLLKRWLSAHFPMIYKLLAKMRGSIVSVRKN